jgi:hypothetical protein
MRSRRAAGGSPLAGCGKTLVFRGRSFSFDITITATNADKKLEFIQDPNNKLQPRDPRYEFMTGQPYASSSYGLFQLTLVAFSPGPQAQLNTVFNPGYSTTCPPTATCIQPITPIYQLIVMPQTNFDLAGTFHRLSYAQLAGLNAFCDNTTPSVCNQALWQTEWTQIIHRFNINGNGYTGLPSGIVTNGDTVYAPQNPNP